jgi:hypothetical protein
MLDTRNPELRVNQRLEAAELAWENAQTDPALRAKAREIFKSLVWSSETPRPLRLRLTEMLLLDSSPEGLADSRSFTVLRLPTESDRAVVGMMALAAATNNWTDAGPSLIRALAEPLADVDDRDRVESMALQRLNPGRTLESIAFGYFAEPGVSAGPREIGWGSRVQADAWTLLSRLDPGGDTRRELVRGAGPAAMGPSGPLLQVLSAGVDELGVIPSTAMELEWLRSLRDRDDSKNAAWWQEVSSIVATLGGPQREGLQLRHLEPLRIAAARSPGWLGAGRDELLLILADRLEGRAYNRRTAEIDGVKANSRERLRDWADTLAWGDALSLLVIDAAVAEPGIADAILKQAVLDREDRKTEYGGVLEVADRGDGSPGPARAVLFPPRPRDRVHDERFVASTDMIAYSDRAFAHYHLQVQRPKNYEYAGPSGGDLRYARLSGRNCVVFTSLAADRLGVDYYQPDGAVIDIGEIPR